MKTLNPTLSSTTPCSWALLAALGLGTLFCDNALADNDYEGYSIKKIAQLGVPAPSGGFHINDFEPGAINNRGDVIYGTDLGTSTDPSTFFGEGVFLQRGSQSSEQELAHGTGTAPGGGVFDFLLLGQAQLNDDGNGAFAFTLSPFGSPVGANSGVYRYSRTTHNVTPVVVPTNTPAPAGGTFVGAFFGTSLNQRNDLVFTGIIVTDKGVHVSDEAYIGLGMGVFKSSRQGQITSVVSPGDSAPGGGKFDMAQAGWINDQGDVAFIAHVAGEESKIEGFPPQAQEISALSSIYIKQAGTGRITSIAHQGSAAPGGGAFRQAYGPVVNDDGDIAFFGDLSVPPHASQVGGVYLYAHGSLIKVARPGDAMPGGGTFKTASVVGSQQIHLNNEREVAFNATLDNHGAVQTGLYVWDHGKVRLVARSGTAIPHVGTIDQLVMGVILVPPPPILVPNSGAINNDFGQVLFGATLTDGTGVLLVATPRDCGDDDHGR